MGLLLFTIACVLFLIYLDDLVDHRKNKDMKEEKKLPEDLEEAATEFANQDCVTFISRKKGFIAGAEWQKKQDQETIELAEDHAMLAGMNKMEQQMMEKAYDTVMQFDELDDLVPTFEDMQKFGFKVGDKVKVIILKEK